jgi:hypothetical protein
MPVVSGHDVEPRNLQGELIHLDLVWLIVYKEHEAGSGLFGHEPALFWARAHRVCAGVSPAAIEERVETEESVQNGLFTGIPVVSCGPVVVV